MPKTFKEKEKKIIRNTLIKEGKECFSRYGLRKTSINQLTQAAGIAQGTFYSFFGSKEELYFEILELEESKIEKDFLENIFKTSPSAKEAIRNIIKLTAELFEKNDFIRRIYDSTDYELLVRKLPPEKLENHRNHDTLFFVNMISKVQQENEAIKTNPQVITGLMRAILISFLHKDEIGSEVYPQVIDLLADIVAEGLVKNTDKEIIKWLKL